MSDVWLMSEITLRGMRFHALIGILPHERTIPQPLEVDLTVRVTQGESVVDYRGLYAVVATATSRPTDYLEELAERIAGDALASNTRVRVVRVAVRKPHVSLGGPLAYAEVVVERGADA